MDNDINSLENKIIDLNNADFLHTFYRSRMTSGTIENLGDSR